MRSRENLLIYNSIHNLFIILLVLGYISLYLIGSDLGLTFILLSNLTMLLFILPHSIKNNFSNLFFGLITMLLFTYNGISNGISINKILFFLNGQFLLLLSVKYNFFGKTSFFIANKSFLCLIFIHFLLLINADSLILGNKEFSSVWSNQNSLAIAVLCPYIIILLTTRKNNILDIISFIYSFILTFMIIYYTDSRSSLLVFIVANILLIPFVKNKITNWFLILIYTTPLTVPLIFFAIQKFIMPNVMTDLGIFRDVWILGVEQLFQVNSNFNPEIGLNSVLFGVNSYGLIFLVFYLYVGYILFKEKKVTSSLILFTVLSLHEVFESSLASGFYGFIIFKALLIVFYNYEKKRITNQYCNTVV